MKMSRLLVKLALGAIVPVAILLTWHFASAGSVVIPSISSVVDVLAHPFRRPANLDATTLAYGAAASVVRVVCGFSLAVLTAIPIGLAMGRWQKATDALSPTITAAMVISPVAWMPVAIIVFGLASPATVIYGDGAWRHDLLDGLRFAIVLVVWFGAFIPIAINTASGVRNVRQSHLEAARVLGASHGQLLRKVILPSAAPAILTGLRLGGGIAWRVIIVAEIFPGTRGGLGYMITTAHQQASYEYAFASIIVICAIGLMLDGLLRLAEARVAKWRPRER